MSSVRHCACPVSPGWMVGSTLLQSVTVKGEVGSFIWNPVSEPALVLLAYVLATVSVIARSPCDEAIQTISADRFWICFASLAMTGDRLVPRMIRRSLHNLSFRIHPQIFADPLSALVLVEHHDAVRADEQFDEREMQVRQKPERLAPIRPQGIL